MMDVCYLQRYIVAQRMYIPYVHTVMFIRELKLTADLIVILYCMFNTDFTSESQNRVLNVRVQNLNITMTYLSELTARKFNRVRECIIPPEKM